MVTASSLITPHRCYNQRQQGGLNASLTCLSPLLAAFLISASCDGGGGEVAPCDHVSTQTC